jgi:hypothetical protein
MGGQREQILGKKIDTGSRDGVYTCLGRGKHRPRMTVQGRKKTTATERENGVTTTSQREGVSITYCAAERGSRVRGSGSTNPPPPFDTFIHTIEKILVICEKA